MVCTPQKASPHGVQAECILRSAGQTRTGCLGRPRESVSALTHREDWPRLPEGYHELPSARTPPNRSRIARGRCTGPQLYRARSLSGCCALLLAQCGRQQSALTRRPSRIGAQSTPSGWGGLFVPPAQGTGPRSEEDKTEPDHRTRMHPLDATDLAAPASATVHQHEHTSSTLAHVRIDLSGYPRKLQ